MLGDEPDSLEVGASYTVRGATALDNYDGDFTASIVVTGTVEPYTLGSYTLSYNVTDTNSNAAITLTRTVHVVGTLGLASVKEVNSLSSYPNPTEFIWTIESSKEINKVLFFNLLG